MVDETQDVSQEAVESTESPLLNTFSEIISSFLQIAQQNVVARIQETVDTTLEQARVVAEQVIQNAVLLFAIVLLGLIGFVFAITGLSLWLGEISNLGAWFGFLIVGTIVFIIALIVGLLQKNKQV